MANSDFNLPGSSIEEIEKIVEAYAQRSQPSTNEDIAQLTGLTKETVSRNNKVPGIDQRHQRRSEEADHGARFALSVAEFVREHYVGYQDIDLVVVNVLRQLDAASTETRAYRFERAQLGEPRSLETSASAQ